MSGITESDFFIKEISDLLTPEELKYLNDQFASLIENKIILPIPVANEEK